MKLDKSVDGNYSMGPYVCLTALIGYEADRVSIKEYYVGIL